MELFLALKSRNTDIIYWMSESSFTQWQMHAASVQQACLSVGQVPSAEIARKEWHYWLCTARTCQTRENRSCVYKLENVQSVPDVGVYLCVESADWWWACWEVETKSKPLYILKARIRVSKKKARKIKVITLILSYLCVQTCFSECQEPSLNNTVRKKLIVLIAKSKNYCRNNKRNVSSKIDLFILILIEKSVEGWLAWI